MSGSVSKLILVFSLFFWSNLLLAQQIKVLDKGTSQPIEDVVVYNATGILGKTDSAGKLFVKSLDSHDIFTFQHPAFQSITLSKEQLKSLGYSVPLSESVKEIDEVIISANKWEQDVNEVPNDILSLSAKEIQFSNAQTSADLLKNTGQVFVQKSQLGGGSPSLRGFAANRVLLVVDGVRMNNAIFRSGNLQNIINIDPNALESSEVVFGPGSVVYGSDALGGVMDFHTITPKFSSQDKIKVQANGTLRYASANEEKTGHLDFSIAGKRLAFFSSFTHSDYGDLKTGKNFDDDYPNLGPRPFYVTRIGNEDVLMPNEDIHVQKFSGFSQWNFVNKLRFRATDYLEFTYSLFHSSTSNFPRYDRLIRPSVDGLRQAEWFYGPQKWNMHHLKASLFAPTKLYDEAKIIATYQRFEESRHDRRFGRDELRNRYEQVDVFTMNLDFDKELGENALYYGLEFTHNDVTSTGNTQNILTGSITEAATRYPDGGSKYQSFAGYANHKWKLNQIVINAGARFSHIRLEGSSTSADAIALGFDQFDISNSALSGSLGAVFEPTTSTRLKSVISTGFRSPNIDDVGKVFEIDEDDSGVPIIVVPNPDLKPEYTYNAEIGLEQNIGTKVKLSVAGFYTFLDNAIVRGNFEINGSNTQIVNGIESELRAQVNTSEANIYGVALALEADLPYNFSLISHFNITKGKDKTNDKPLRHTTPNFGKTSLRYEKDRLQAAFSVEFNGNRFRADIPSTEINDKSYLYGIHISDASKDGSPGWHIFNFNTSYQINKFLKVNGAIENIGDKHYRPYSSGISAPGRNFIISLNAKI